MLTVQDKEQIRQEYFGSGRPSMREVAKERGHSWRTVKKAILDPSPSVYRQKRPRACPVVGPFIGLIEEMLISDQHRPKKQRHTARRIWNRMREEHGFLGEESSVCRYVRRWKREHADESSRVTAVIEHTPGTQGQVDWGEVVWKRNGEEVVGHMFEMTLPFSVGTYARVYPFEKQEAFFDGHMRGFDFFGGVPGQMRYDNLKTAVAKVLKGRARIEQDSFVHFRSHHGFESSFCTPGRGNEKGSVEGNIGYGRRNWFVPLPSFASLEELNVWLEGKCRENLARVPQGRTMSIRDALAEERRLFLPQPRVAFDACRVVLATADHHALVHFDGSRYSVPVSCAFRDVTVRAYVDRVVISADGREVARHPRALTPGALVQDPQHFLRLLERKPALLDHASVFRQWDIPDVFRRYRDTLRARAVPDAEDVALRSVARVLAMAGIHGLDRVAAVVEDALRTGRVETEEIARALASGAASAPSTIATSTFPRIEIPVPSLAQYQSLLARPQSATAAEGR